MSLAIAMFVAAGCEAKPLPEAGTMPADLYVEECGRCHPAYAPSLLTAGMWKSMVDRMEIQMRRRGLELSPDRRSEILAYLERNAGGR